MKDLTQSELKKRFRGLSWKSASAREAVRALLELHDDFVKRNRQAFFRGVLLTIGQTFVEDNPTIHKLLMRTEEAPPRTSEPRLVRGSIGRGESEEKPPLEEHGLRVYRMSELRGKPTRENLLRDYPTMDKLRAFCRERGIRLNPAYKYVESAVDAVLAQLEESEV